MKAIVFLVGTCTLFNCVSTKAQNAVAPSITTAPLGTAQLAMYRDFLATWNAGAKTALNVASTTEPFAPLDDDLKGCLRQFPKVHHAMVYTIPASAFDGLDVLLVDPRTHQKRDPGDAIRNGQPVDDAVDAGIAAGIFTFSETIFNSYHTRAAFTYSFVCGGLCGNGGTIIFQRKNGKWIREKNRCGSWES